MYEFSPAQKYHYRIEEQAVNHQFSKVKQVWLEIGVMACVVPRYFWPRMSPLVIPLSDNARFHITIAPAQGWCLRPVINPYLSNIHTLLSLLSFRQSADR